MLAAARFGGDVPGALRQAAREPGADGLVGLAACWRVAVDGGAGLAAGLDRLECRAARGEGSTGRAAGPIGGRLVDGRRARAAPGGGAGDGMGDGRGSTARAAAHTCGPGAAWRWAGCWKARACGGPRGSCGRGRRHDRTLRPQPVDGGLGARSLGCLALGVAAGRRERRVRGRLAALLAVERGQRRPAASSGGGGGDVGATLGPAAGRRRSPVGRWSVEWPDGRWGSRARTGSCRWLRTRKPDDRTETEEAARQLPLAADLLAACVAAGAGPREAAEAVGESLGGPVGDQLALTAGGAPARWRTGRGVGALRRDTGCGGAGPLSGAGRVLRSAGGGAGGPAGRGLPDGAVPGRPCQGPARAGV